MLDYTELSCREAPRILMVWLHGLGADGYDLQPAAEMLELPGFRHVFPHAPVRPVTINSGMAMRAWYDIAAPDLRWQEDSTGMQASVRQVQELLQALRKDSALPVVLAGFSQGAVISLATAAMGIPGLIGVVAMSGYVPDFMLPLLGRLRGVPVWMAHGEEDGVIPFALAKASHTLLADSGVEVAWHTYAMTHTISQSELHDLSLWLGRLPGLPSSNPAG